LVDKIVDQGGEEQEEVSTRQKQQPEVANVSSQKLHIVKTDNQ
jgi:hypothetical protein